MYQQGTKGELIKDPNEYMQSLPKVQGPDFNKIDKLEDMFESYKSMGIQSGYLHKSIEIVKSMLTWRLSDEPINDNDKEEWKDPEVRKQQKCFVFLGYTSNMVSSGVRDVIRYLAQHRLIDAIVTTAGGIEEDFIKCYGDFRAGNFHNNDFDFREHCIERNGNIILHDDIYCEFNEQLLFPAITELLKKQKENGEICSPSKLIDYLGMKVNNEESIYYWCHKNSIPVFSPALTDGGIGDALVEYASKYESGFILDINQDIQKIFQLANNAPRTGAVIMGGGVAKHHIFNANYQIGGLYYTVLINMGIEHDASDSGAMITEGICWKKLSDVGLHTKIFSEASIVFPILVALSFCVIKKQQLAENIKK